jgi:hypothetical protein
VNIDQKLLLYICNLGSGKGEITKKSIINGISKLITITESIKFLKNNYTEEEIEEMYKSINVK